MEEGDRWERAYSIFCKADMRIWGTEGGLLYFALRGSRQEKRKMDTARIMIIPVAYSKINILKQKKSP